MADEEKIVDGVQAFPESEEMPSKTIRRNMFCCITMDCMWTVGWQGGVSLALVESLTYLEASGTQTGLIYGSSLISLVGIFLTPFITRLFPYKKWYFFITNIPYLLPLGLIGAMVLVSGKLNLSSDAMLSFMLVSMLAHWFFGGFLGIPKREFIAACVPATHRGRLTGLFLAIGGLLSIGSITVGGLVIKYITIPLSFGYLFLVGWIVMQSGYIAAIFAKERRTPVELSPKPWSKAMLKAFWQDKNYLKFTILNFLVNLFQGSMIWNMFMVYGRKELAATTAVMAVIRQVILMACSTPGGILADKIGPKRIIPVCRLIMCFSFWPALLMGNAMGVYLGIALSAFSGAASGPAWTSLGYGLPKPEDRAGHFAISAVTGISALSLGPIMTGIMSDIFSSRTVFMGISVIGFMIFLLTVYMIRTFPDSAREMS